MPEWLPAALAIFLGSSVVVALITAPLTYRVGMRQAGAQGRTAEAAQGQVLVSQGQLAMQIEQAVTARMEHYREETEGLMQANVELRVGLSAEVARLREQVGTALAEIGLNRDTIREQTIQIATAAGKIADLSAENRRCLDALFERDRRERDRDQRELVLRAHLRAAADT